MSIAPFKIVVGAVAGLLILATTVPTDIQEPGTQPSEVVSLQRAGLCDNCHVITPPSTSHMPPGIVP